ncbi:MAG: type II CRISPR RNA-guided endonuclease Cas9 [Proteobacteria bacterium]|nr:type II CRISPR RNA-guided endonuclease Cas9 [Pseudomonadota bacterium]
MANKMAYRLALDLGSTSLGWAMIRLDVQNNPIAVIKAGSRIFSDGREPAAKGQVGTSLAATRRNARAMRRRRDRLLKRKARMMRALIEHGFFPADEVERKALEQLDPYALRAKGLDEALTPAEFARALFHINQRRGFKSNRKTDSKESDSSVMKGAIHSLRTLLDGGEARTVGEWLHQRTQRGEPTRARRRENIITNESGRNKKEVRYDLYIDRAMVEQEFDAIWAKQSSLNPAIFTETIGRELKDILLHQRPLKPVRPGRCTLIPTEERAPLALPSVQRFRIYQEANNLRVLARGLEAVALTLEQRDKVVDALERNGKQTFAQLKKLLALGGSATFTHEDVKRTELKGNGTSAALSKASHFGKTWFDFDGNLQDEIVTRILTEESEVALVNWLMTNTGIDEAHAESIAQVGLAEGFGSLSRAALARILPELARDVVTYDRAVIAAGFEHHSNLSPAATGEILPELPYYGEPLQRYVGFADPRATESDPPEKRFGRIANPTVHIGLNQTRKVVNALIRKYGHPAEVIVEVARELKQSKEQRDEESKRQRANQDRNERYRGLIAGQLGISEEKVRRDDLQKVLLWEELNLGDALNRKCPYSGVSISLGMLLSDQVEVEHILPFSMTLDDSLNNKTVAMRNANRDKGNATPWQAFGERTVPGYDFDAILQRAELMPKNKRYRFGKDGYQQWLREDKDFLARALNDTRYLSRVAREYLRLVCPGARVIPGQMTAMLRGRFGLNTVLGVNGEKNRNDHRHHAVDACVIGVTDQGMLQQFARASASAREKHLTRLVETMPEPFPNYRAHVERAVKAIWVSHKPDHSHEGAMHNETAYGLLAEGRVRHHKPIDGKRELVIETLKVIPITSQRGADRHSRLDDGSPRPYKGYKGDSNYCIDIVRNEKGKWDGEVVSTFAAYQIVRAEGVARLRDSRLSISGKPLVMRLIVNDYVRLNVDGAQRTMRVASINSAGRLSLADHHEANVDARNRAPSGLWRYTYKQAGSLQSALAHRVTISPIGEVNDPGFKG